MIKTSKLYNRLTFLSEELDNGANQKLVLETDSPSSFDEDSMFTLNVGPEKGFENSEMIQFTQTEARELWLFLSRFFHI